MTDDERWRRRSVRAVRKHQRELAAQRRRELRREIGKKKARGCAVTALVAGAAALTVAATWRRLT